MKNLEKLETLQVSVTSLIKTSVIVALLSYIAGCRSDDFLVFGFDYDRLRFYAGEIDKPTKVIPIESLETQDLLCLKSEDYKRLLDRCAVTN